MTAGIPRYMVEPGLIEGSRTQGVILALAAARQICREQSADTIALVMSTKHHLPNSIVAEALGAAATKALVKGNTVSLGQGGPALAFYSTATFPRYRPQGVVIGAHISGEDQRKIENALDAKAAIYLPWQKDEAIEYLTTWHPTIIGPSTLAPMGDTLSAEVEEALTRLTGLINLSTGLGHPSDKAAAVRMVQSLAVVGHRPDPAAIERWALRHAWSVHASKDLADLFRKAQR